MSDEGRRAVVKLLTFGVPGLAGCEHAHSSEAPPEQEFSNHWSSAKFPNQPDGRIYFHRTEAGRPPVVVLHEILGLNPGCFELGNRLWNSGFSVFLPLLFGNVGGHGFLGGFLRSCGSSEFSCGANDKASSITASLLEFCEHVSAESSGRRIGVIGMCISGAFPIWLMRSETIVAPVLCQPTMPFSVFGPGEPTALGLSRDDIRLAIRRHDVPILGMRFTKDANCPMQRFTVLSELFGRRFRALEIPSGIGNVDSDAHSVLVGSFWQPAYEGTVQFLRERL